MPAPPTNLLEPRSTSNLSVPSMTTILSVAQPVVGVVPIAVTQIQAVLNLALMLARQMKDLQVLHSSEVELLTRLETTISIILETALDDERCRYEPRFIEALEHIRSSLYYVKSYLDTRANRTFYQWYRAFFTKGYVKNAKDCRDFLDLSLDRFKLVCSIQTELAYDDMSAKMILLERVVTDTLATLATASQPLTSSDSICPDQQQHRRTGVKESEIRPSPDPNFIRSISPAHDEHVRHMRDLSDGKDVDPPKVRRTRRNRRKRTIATQHLRDDDAGTVSDTEYLSEGNCDVTSTHRIQSRRVGRETYDNLRRRGVVILDENFYSEAPDPTLKYDMDSATNIHALPPSSRMAQYANMSVGPNENAPMHVRLPPASGNSGASDASESSPSINHARSLVSPAQIPMSYVIGDGRCGQQNNLEHLLESLFDIDLTNDIFDETAYLQAHGGFCDVFMAKSRRHGNIKVAVKRLRIHIFNDKDISKMVFRELKIWSSLEHPNVLPLLGYIMHDKYPALISQWMSRGSLRKYIETTPRTKTINLYLARDIAKGLKYLHDMNIIHSDLKALEQDNILISDNNNPLIADFGISRILTSTNTSWTNLGGSARWMAMELLEFNPGDGTSGTGSGRHTKGTDVWAYGMVVYELLSGSVPYAALKNEFQVASAISKGQTPCIPSSVKPDDRNDKVLWAVCQNCWEKSPANRWSMDAMDRKHVS
ncbi:kinase-like protein [Schizopora paradoxa]|uniref:Kinase-like protein n=1 Tax=Schizopora paradoxa TaxID=27342 RepID=A0A0H2RGN3_9AGAM|nr:kinase-like protein [Schizopora paradoxa]